MNPNHFNRFIHAGLFFCACASVGCLAQQGPQDGPPPRIDIAAVTGADAKTAQAVDRVLRAQHEKIDAARQEADTQLAKLLTPAQLEKLHQAMRKNRPSDGPPQRSY